MATALTDRQKDDLHKSILDYLLSAGFMKTYEQFKQETPELNEFAPDLTGKTSGLLAKKWTSVIRMQKKIMELELRLAQALEEVSHLGHLSGGGPVRVNRDWLPASPSKYTLTGHRQQVTAVAFHPRFSVMASASKDATVKIWDWPSGEMEKTLKGHTKMVTDCQYDSGGKVLATSSYDLFVKLWKVDEDYQNFATLRGHEHSVSSVRFLSDARVISSSRDTTLRIWDIASAHCVKLIKLGSWIRSGIPSHDGRFVLTASDDRTACIVDVESGAVKTEMRGHDHVVQVAVFAPNLAVPAIRDLVALPATAHTSKVDALGMSFVATGSRDKTVKIWDALTGQCLWTFIGHDNWVQALVFHPSGKYMLSAADDYTIRIWDLKTGRCIKKVAEAHTKFITCMAWAPQNNGDGTDKPVNAVVTGSLDMTVKVWVP